MELTTINTNNYSAMAKAMGIANEGVTERNKQVLLHVFVYLTLLSWERAR